MTPSRAPADRPLLTWTPAEATAEATKRALLVMLHGAEEST